MVAHISNVNMDVELCFKNLVSNESRRCFLSATYLDDLCWFEQNFSSDCGKFQTVLGKSFSDDDQETDLVELTEDELLMQSFGLPLSFGNPERKKGRSYHNRTYDVICYDKENAMNKPNSLEDSMSELSIDVSDSSESNVEKLAEESKQPIGPHLEDLSQNNADLTYSSTSVKPDNCDEKNEYSAISSNSMSEDWLVYWGRQGDQLVWNSWCVKYLDYLDPKYLESRQTTSDTVNTFQDVSGELDGASDKRAERQDACLNQEMDNDCNASTEDSDYSDEWSLLWNDHYSQVYSDMHEQFSSSYIQCSKETAGRSGENSKQSETTVKNKERRDTCSAVKGSNKSSNVLGGSNSSDGDDEPPEEKGSKCKRPHEEEVDGEDIAVAMKNALKAARFEAATDKSCENKFKTSLLKMKFRTTQLMNRYKKFRNIISEVKNVESEKKSADDNNELDEANVQFPVKDGTKILTESGPRVGASVKNSINKYHPSDKKRRKKPQVVKKNPSIRKFWERRYSLFSKYDEGIKLDKESWYSVTPEKLAIHHAQRAKCVIMVDTCCGVGGNAIQFAFLCDHVIAIDICDEKLSMAKFNAQLYGVEGKIEFIQGDCLATLASLKHADVVFIDPPWGGIEVTSADIFTLENTKPNARTVFEAAKKLTDDIIMFMPRNTNAVELISLAGPGGNVEIEKNYLNNRFLTLTAYYGNLVNSTHNE